MHSAQVGNFLFKLRYYLNLYIFSTISISVCHLLSLDLTGKKQLLERIFVRSTEQDVHFTQYHMCHPGKQRKSDFLRCLSLSSRHNKIIPLFDIFQTCQENSILPTFYIFKLVCIRNIPLTSQTSSYRMSK